MTDKCSSIKLFKYLNNIFKIFSEDISSLWIFSYFLLIHSQKDVSKEKKCHETNLISFCLSIFKISKCFDLSGNLNSSTVSFIRTGKKDWQGQKTLLRHFVEFFGNFIEKLYLVAYFVQNSFELYSQKLKSLYIGKMSSKGASTLISLSIVFLPKSVTIYKQYLH